MDALWLITTLVGLDNQTVSSFGGPATVSGVTHFWDINNSSSLTISSGIAQVNDLVGSTNLTGVSTAKPAYSATGGFNNRAYAEFDGVNDLLSGTTSVLFGANKFSIAIRVLGGAQTNHAFVARGDTTVNPDFLLATGNILSSKLRFATGDVANSSVIESTTTAFDGAWHTLVVTWDGTTQTMYIDSSTADATTGVPSPSENLGTSNAIYVGARADSGTTPSLFFAGRIEFVAIYNKVISATDIGNLMSYGS